MKHISYAELKVWQATGKVFQLIDVRALHEHQAFNIGGILIPFTDILNHLEQLNFKHPIVFYCQKGIRSQIAIQRLTSKVTCDKLYNLQGGISFLQKR